MKSEYEELAEETREKIDKWVIKHMVKARTYDIHRTTESLKTECQRMLGQYVKSDWLKDSMVKLGFQAEQTNSCNWRSRARYHPSIKAPRPARVGYRMY